MAGIENCNGFQRGPGDADRVLADWSSFLLLDRGVSPATVTNYVRHGRRFLEFVTVEGCLDLAVLSVGDVAAFLKERLPNFVASSRAYFLSAMRSLLRFLYLSDQIPVRLDGAVLASAGHRNAGVPRWLPVSDVALMLSTCDQSTVSGARSRAIVTIISRLGLRALEVQRLSLDDVDWRSGTLKIVGKGGYTDAMPLPVDVGEALDRYLVLAPRPPGQRALFLRLRNPGKPLTRSAIGAVVSSAGVRAGLGPVGTHRLRHTVATATVNAGASLEEVGQLLRHRSLGSTTIYAKVDTTHLALLARPWPGTTLAADGGEQL